MKYQNSGNTKKYTGRGIVFSLLGSIFSNNRFNAEKTCKKLPRASKIKLAKSGAKKYKRRWFGF